MPGDLYEQTRVVARARRTSVSALMRRLLEDLARTERERELDQAYELLGRDPGADVEREFEAQAEVARRG